MNILSLLHLCVDRYRKILYGILLPYKVFRVRRKNRIRVLFVVSEISMWKTENLYQQMLLNNRFDPLLLALPHCHDSKANEKVEVYFKKKGYSYEQLQTGQTIKSAIHPDIIFYQQPYLDFIDRAYSSIRNRYALFCHVNYCFRNSVVKSTVDLPLLNLAWKVFEENQLCIDEIAPLMRNNGRNLCNTGLPVMDELIKDKSAFFDPWKKSTSNKKRIIYAPHHSILEGDILNWGTILEYGEFVLQMAQKYKDRTQWIFKPHPFLEKKLRIVWGEERTDAYFNAWRNLENAQVLDGNYLAAFKYSDAMIHDCGSFMIEYLYCDNPVMYLYGSRPDNGVILNSLSIKARSVHYSAHTNEDIEYFIKDVISGNDELCNQRETLLRDHLVPIGGSACQNIIESILG